MTTSQIADAEDKAKTNRDSALKRPVKAFDAVLNAVVMELQRTQGAKVKLTL